VDLFASLLPSGLFSKIFLVILIWSILITCSNYSNLFHLISTTRSGVIYCHMIGCDYRWVLDWWPDLLDSLIHCVTTLYSSLLRTWLVMCSLSLLGSYFQWQRFPFLWVPKLSPVSATTTANWSCL
jgi:hypothetical protein